MYLRCSTKQDPSFSSPLFISFARLQKEVGKPGPYLVKKNAKDGIYYKEMEIVYHLWSQLLNNVFFKLILLNRFLSNLFGI